MITLVAVLCHLLGPGIDSCVEEIVVGKYDVPPMAGTVADPIQLPPMTLAQCQIVGQKIVSVWMQAHPVYHSWTLRGWKCAPGEYTPQHRA